MHMNPSAKILAAQNVYIKKNKSKFALKNQNEPSVASIKYQKDEKDRRKDRREGISQLSINYSPRNLGGFSSYRNSAEDSLLSKLKKQGSISNATSKHSSPARNNTKDQTHRRMFSHVQAVQKIDKSQETKHSSVLKQLLQKSLFDYKHVIGKGGFGKVWKVELKKNKKVYALKEMSKALIISKKSVPSVMNEKALLVSLKNPFLVNMVQSFQDRQSLYLVMDYLPGGDLRHHIAKRKKFQEQQAKFIIVCIYLGLRYLHESKIIHRDIKPQNIVLDERGYARITDLGVARAYRTNNSNDTSGTPGYMAPQVLCRQNHSYQVDYFALGVIAYQLMLRKRPYFGRNRKQIRDQILAKQVLVKKHQIPDNWSLEAADFINRLIQRKPTDRMGAKSPNQIASHPWLRNFPMNRIEQKSVQAPFIPKTDCQNRWQQSNMSSQNTEIKELIIQNQIMLRNQDVQQLFVGYQTTLF